MHPRLTLINLAVLLCVSVSCTYILSTIHTLHDALNRAAMYVCMYVDLPCLALPCIPAASNFTGMRVLPGGQRFRRRGPRTNILGLTVPSNSTFLGCDAGFCCLKMQETAQDQMAACARLAFRCGGPDARGDVPLNHLPALSDERRCSKSVSVVRESVALVTACGPIPVMFLLPCGSCAFATERGQGP